MARHASQERIEEEASLWAARLDGGGMTEADRVALDRWLAADPEHRWVLSRYRTLGAQLDEQLGAAAESVAWLAAAAQRRRRRWTTATFAAAAGLAILFFVLTGQSDAIKTKTAERHVAALADGSRVELNARTELAVSFRRDERHVKLMRGEALFTVAKDPARPFVVETPAGIIRVTGTIFNVRAARDPLDALRISGRIEVTVLEGHVRVHADGDADGDEAITPGRQAVMDGGRVTVTPLSESATQDVILWRQGQVIFDETPLRDAVERFAGYHARTITVDANVAKLRIGGRYALDDLDGFLDAIERVLPVRVEREAGGAARIVAASAK